MRRLYSLLALLLWLCLPCTALTQSMEGKIVLIYESGGSESDQSFIDMARRGAQKAKRELEAEYYEHALGAGDNRQQVFADFAQQNPKLIIALGFQNVSTVVKVAQEYPDTYFTLIDGLVPPVFSNVQSIVFQNNQGAYLVGMIAAVHSKNGKLGFIGGMDVPVIRDFAYGFQQGAESVNKEIEVMRDMVGTEASAWNNPQKAALLAQRQIARGADVLFAAAGGSSVGVLRKAVEYENVYAIGVDTNQNHLFPGTMLTSLVKRVDKAVYRAIKQSLDNSWQPGVLKMGIREGALDYAVDIHNRTLLQKESVAQAERIKDLIIQGILQVDEYRQQ